MLTGRANRCLNCAHALIMMDASLVQELLDSGHTYAEIASDLKRRSIPNTRSGVFGELSNDIVCEPLASLIKRKR